MLFTLNVQAYQQQIFEAYESKTEKSLQQRLSSLVRHSQDPAVMHFDLALVATQQHKPDIARFHFLQAAKLNTTNELYLAWKVFSISDYPGLSINQLKNLENELKVALTKSPKSALNELSTFTFRSLASIQVQIAKKVAASDAPEWFQAARDTIDLSLQQTKDSSNRDYAYSGQLFVASAAWYDEQYRNARNNILEHAQYHDYLTSKKSYEGSLATLTKLEQDAEYSLNSLNNTTQISDWNHKVESIIEQRSVDRVAIQQTQEQVKKLAESSDALEDKLLATTSNDERLKKTYSATMKAYNRHVVEVNKLTRKINGSIDLLNSVTKKLHLKLKDNHHEAYQKYNAHVVTHNKEILPEYNRLSKAIHELDQLWKSPLFQRDQALANARAHLITAVNENPSDQVSAKLFVKLEKQTLGHTDSNLFTDKTWCKRIDYHCGSCSGLEKISCDQAVSDAQDACFADKYYQPFISHIGQGGVKGSCRHTKPLQLSETIATDVDYLPRVLKQTVAEQHETTLWRQKLEYILSQLFKSDASLQKALVQWRHRYENKATMNPFATLMRVNNVKTIPGIKALEAWVEVQEVLLSQKDQ
ncbi:MAG: hypothetical protein HOM11_15535, partial [Methylococcales bacterium]|jgi:hypothetical protein|nr:hypothetical protein [Methylococcales bacterium]MBT7442817.1 hypothetical protein [Methylococcales bacterium]